MARPFLSIIIPAHNEESRLPASLRKISDFIQTVSFAVEVVVVENASTDRTLELTQKAAETMPFLRVIHETRRGKGLAVQRGMLEALGEYRFICDADLSMPIEQVLRFLPPQLQDADVAIASREAAGAKRYNEPEIRHLIGRVFNAMVRLMILPKYNDTQCGFKLFNARSAEEVFRKQTFDGWSFDVEALYIAQINGYRIREVPIDWYHIPGSRIKIFKDSIQMFLDLLTIRRNARKGLYGRASHPETR